jgi:hypothetical protein
MLNTGFQHSSVALYTLGVNILISGSVIMLVYSNRHPYFIMFLLCLLAIALLPTVGIKRIMIRFVLNDLLPALKGNVPHQSDLQKKLDLPQEKVIDFPKETEKRLSR